MFSMGKIGAVSQMAKGIAGKGKEMHYRKAFLNVKCPELLKSCSKSTAKEGKQLFSKEEARPFYSFQKS